MIKHDYYRKDCTCPTCLGHFSNDSEELIETVSVLHKENKRLRQEVASYKEVIGALCEIIEGLSSSSEYNER